MTTIYRMSNEQYAQLFDENSKVEIAPRSYRQSTRLRVTGLRSLDRQLARGEDRNLSTW